MTFMSSFVVALLSGALGLMLAFAIAAACTSWYSISGFEGKSGYFVVFNALFGAIGGVAIGIACAIAVATFSTPGFVKTLGLSFAIIVTAAALIALVARLRADIPPRLDGLTLDLEIELRLPVGVATLPPAGAPGNTLTFGSVVRHVQRKSRPGELDMANARQEDGRWIVPGKAFLFTRRGLRSLSIELDGKSVGGFIVPLPARPGKRFENWSEWGPRGRGRGVPWPDTESSYRFRVQRRLPPPPEPDPDEVEAARFAALEPGAPLADWLRFMDNNAPQDRVAMVMEVVARRHVEHAAAIRSNGSKDDAVRELALQAVTQLGRIEPEIAAAVMDEQRRLVKHLVRFNAMPPEDPRSIDVQIALRTRFSYWHRAWWTVHQLTGVDGRPPVQEILELAQVHAQGTTMDEIVANARAHLDGLPAPAPAPAARPA